MSDLGKVFVKDYVELGLAEGVSDTVLRSLDGENEVEFVTEGDDTLQLFVNGDHVETLEYADPDFNTKLVARISSPLNF